MLLDEVARFSPRQAAAAPSKGLDPGTVEKLTSLGYLAHGRRSAGPAPGRNLPDPKERIEVYNLISDGTLAARNADYGRATKLLTEAVRREPTSLVAHFQLGVVYRVTNALDKAEQEFRKTLELRPGYDLALRRLAEVYMAGGRYDEAERAYKEVLAQSPDDAAVHFSLGGLYVTVDRWEDALAAFRKAEALNPRDVLTPIVISRILLRKGDPGRRAGGGPAGAEAGAQPGRGPRDCAGDLPEAGKDRRSRNGGAAPFSGSDQSRR